MERYGKNIITYKCKIKSMLVVLPTLKNIKIKFYSVQNHFCDAKYKYALNY
jgi:hypothetical protein